MTWPHKTARLKDHMTLWVGALIVCRHPDKFGDHRHCDMGDLIILI